MLGLFALVAMVAVAQTIEPVDSKPLTWSLEATKGFGVVDKELI